MTAEAIGKFEIFYDAYSAMANNVALQISTSPAEAERIFSAAFKKASQLNIVEQRFPSPCIALISILIDTAHQQRNNTIGKMNFRHRQFAATPILHHLLCEKSSIESYCSDHEITRQQASNKLRTEVLLLRKSLTGQRLEIQGA